jgi:kynurenine formamidase
MLTINPRTASLLAAATFCALGVTPVAAEGLDMATAELVDLTHAIDRNTIFWPTEAKTFELVEEHRGITDKGYFYAANRFSMPEHGGTHIDAPFHFAAKGTTVGDIPVQRLVAPAAVIDISSRAAADPDATLSVDDINAWERAHGKLAPGSIVLLRTGWSSRWPDKRAYLGDDTPGDVSHLHFPSYGAEAAKVLVERGVSVIGVDTASIDTGTSKEFLVHRIAGAANVIGVENLTNLDKLPATGAWVAALPMKIASGSGAPARVVAFVLPR